MKAIYTAVFLDESSKKKLLLWWELRVGSEVLRKEYAHHVTLVFKPKDSEVARLTLGEEVDITVIGYAEDEYCQAVQVKMGPQSANAIPHITVATDGGTSPVYSNDLLSSKKEPVLGPTLKGKVGYWDGKQAVFEVL